MKEKGIIYKTTNLVNGMIYIGQHSLNKPNYLGSGKLLKEAIKTFGKENFDRIILEECNIDELNNRETFWITYFNSFNRDIGYNLTKTGRISTYGIKYSDESKKKLSEAKKGDRNPNFGKKLNDAEKSKFTNKGLTRTEEWINKLSEAKKGDRNPNFGKPAHNRDKPHSDETKAKLKSAARNRKRVICPHCNKICAISQAKQFHLDNCKFRLANRIK
jgi:group I intron endonuclease